MIELKNISKTFQTADGTVEALKNVNLSIEDGDIYGIIGMSGAGKSTLVRCINMLERPTEGSVIINGVDIGKLGAAELRRERRKITMIFQGFNLLMQRTCIDNICFPLELAGVKKKEARKKAAELLETVGLPDKGGAYPAQQSILDLIAEINERLGITVIVITHQMSVVEKICSKVAILDGGEVVEEGSVSEVFTNPHSDAAKRLVFPDGAESSVPSFASDSVIRLVYNGALVADTPLIAKMAKDEGIAANILAAQTKCIGDKVFGNMLLDIDGGEKELERAITYLQNTPDIIVRRVKNDV